MKRAASEIEVRMNNIQSVDKEIYKNLQNSVNRDKELLEKAASALARGEKREDVSAILEQIITSWWFISICLDIFEIADNNFSFFYAILDLVAQVHNEYFIVIDVQLRWFISLLHCIILFYTFL